jgi:thioredoxin reductase (NADPH)
MSDRPRYDVVVVGGGPGGLTTALYTTRLGHRTAVFDEQGGRHSAVVDVHNLYGVSEDLSGDRLSEVAVRQFEEYGGHFYPDAVEAVRRDGDGDGSGGRFRVEARRASVEADRVVLATGFRDRDPDVPNLRRFTGRGLHYCLHCDAYALGDGAAFVLGRGEHAAEVAMVMLNFTDDVDLLLDGDAPEWSAEAEKQLRAHPIDRVDEAVVSAFAADEAAAEPWLGGLAFADGTEREYLGGFAMYGKEYNTSLAESVGCDLADDGAILVDDGFETSVEGAYAVGDVTHGQNQTAVAVGDGARAGIAVHKSLRRFPRPLDELEGGDVDESDVPAAAAELRARMRRVRTYGAHAGLREPAPGRSRSDEE